MNITCFGFLVVFSCQVPEQSQIDSFCQVYQPVIQKKGDGTITATDGVKRRILANELTYRRACKK